MSLFEKFKLWFLIRQVEKHRHKNNKRYELLEEMKERGYSFTDWQDANRAWRQIERELPILIFALALVLLAILFAYLGITL